ncbi:MAG: hypothetical protein ACTTI5_06510 [Treponema sp.]
MSTFFSGATADIAELYFAPVLQGNFCTHALSRMVNPAQAVFSVVCFVYIFQRNNRRYWADSREHILKDVTYFLSAQDFADAKLAVFVLMRFRAW